MCGRFAIYSSMKSIKEYAEALSVIDNFSCNYNAAPGQHIPVIIKHHNNNILKQIKWGFVPRWAKDEKIGYRLINTRAESVDSRSSFKFAFEKRRCLIPANGFYEWQKPGKIPYYITLTDRELFCFAGIWESWKSPSGKEIQSCTIITTATNPLIKPIHNRMPVILSRDVEQYWLQGDNSTILKQLLKSYPADKMQAHIVSKEVNSYQNNYSGLMDEMKVEAEQFEFF